MNQGATVRKRWTGLATSVAIVASILAVNNVIGAKADRITPFSHARRLASHFRAPLVAFHGGHLLQLGRGDAFERLGELLRSIV